MNSETLAYVIILLPLLYCFKIGINVPFKVVENKTQRLLTLGMKGHS